MDGSHATSVVHEDLSCPSSLAIDLVLMDLYWVDVDRGVIETAKVDGSGRKVRKHSAVGVFCHENLIWK